MTLLKPHPITLRLKRSKTADKKIKMEYPNVIRETKTNKGDRVLELGSSKVQIDLNLNEETLNF